MMPQTAGSLKAAALRFLQLEDELIAYPPPCQPGVAGITEIAGDELVVAVIDRILRSVAGGRYYGTDLALHIDEASGHPRIFNSELRNSKEQDLCPDRIHGELGAAALAVESVMVCVTRVAGGDVQSLEGREPFRGDRRQVHGATCIDEHEAQCASIISPAGNVLDAIYVGCAEVSASCDEVAGGGADWSGLADSVSGEEVNLGDVAAAAGITVIVR